MKLVPHWSNPWPYAIYVPIEELAECYVGLDKLCGLPDGSSVRMTKDWILDHWRTAGEALDAYILPYSGGQHCMGIRYGSKPEQYLSPQGDKQKLTALIQKYQYLEGIDL